MESLIEQRVASDAGADPRLVRISVGVEEFEVDSYAELSTFELSDSLCEGFEGRFDEGIQRDHCTTCEIVEHWQTCGTFVLMYSTSVVPLCDLCVCWIRTPPLSLLNAYTCMPKAG